MHRRKFLIRLAQAGAVSLGAVGRSLHAADKPARLLDDFRAALFRWSERLWDPQTAGYRQNDAVGVNLMSTTDIAWIRYAVNEEQLDGGHREAWIGYLQRAQDPKTGVVAYNAPPGGHTHNNGHCLWHTVRALNILGGQLLHFPHYLRPALTPAGLNAWFEERDWEGQAHHHEVLGLIPLLANRNDADWTEAFYRQLARQQNPDNGCWPKGRPNVSRTFAYTVLHRGVGRMPPHAEKMIDTMLDMQGKSGLWGSQPTFHTMDAAYILVRLPSKLSYREGEARDALARLGGAMRAYVRDQFEEVCREGTHRMLSIAHTLGLLQEAFPDEYPSQRPYRFHWDDPRQYRCDVIVRES